MDFGTFTVTVDHKRDIDIEREIEGAHDEPSVHHNLHFMHYAVALNLRHG